MDIIEYYKAKFEDDLRSIINTSDFAKDRISIHSLGVDRIKGDGHFKDAQEAFFAINNKPYFLFCYFYIVLIDQAIHANFNHEHSNFERISGYPKFAGILSSYWSNMEPTNLLSIATNYIEQGDGIDVLESFKTITDYMLDDYIYFFHNTFPKYANSINTRSLQDEALKHIFTDIASSIKIDNIHTLAIQPHDRRLYKLLIEYLLQQVDNILLTKLQ